MCVHVRERSRRLQLIVITTMLTAHIVSRWYQVGRTSQSTATSAVFLLSEPSVPAPQGTAARRTWRFETEETLEREVYLLLQHISGELIYELSTLLKPAGITPEQYHVLRILEDAGSSGTPLSAVAERSPVGDPDVTRLLDRLEQRGVARRDRDSVDRRVVTARITNDGRRLLAELKRPVAALHARQLAPLGDRGLETLRKLLRKAAEVGPV